MKTKASSSVLIGALALGASAATTWNYLRDGPSKWENPDGSGNVQAEIGDTKVNWGTTPPWTALDKIKEHCLSIACGPGRTLTVDTDVSEGDDKIKTQIEITVSGAFADNGEMGDIDQLVELAKSTVAYSNYNVEKAYQLVDDKCIGMTGGGAPTSCTKGSKQEFDQYHATSNIGVKAEDKENDLHAFMTVDIKVKEVGGFGGACENIASAGSSLAGAVNGVAGGIFGLFSLGCKLLD